jgi:hypothetical protein
MLEASRADRTPSATSTAKARPSAIKTVESDGQPIGAGWTLTTADVQKSLPATPMSSTAQSDNYRVATPRLQSDTEGSQETTWQSLLDYINDNNRAFTPPNSSTQKYTEDNVDPAATLIDQVFRFGMLTSISKKSAMKRLPDDSSPAEQIRALQERQDVLEQMLIELQRRRTIRSDSEERHRQRWHRQSTVRQQLSTAERGALEQAEEQRRQKVEREKEEEEEDYRTIKLIMFPPSSSP